MSRVKYQVQVGSNRDVLWVHSSDGDTRARFSKVFGIDLHTSTAEQMNGAAQCLHCTHGRASYQDWLFFREKVRELWGLEIPEDTIRYTSAERGVLLTPPSPLSSGWWAGFRRWLSSRQ